MAYIPLPFKARVKVLTEMLELHKRCLKTYLVQNGKLSLKGRRHFFKLYDHFINEDNIRSYFYYPANIFVIHLIQDKLDDIKNRYPKINQKKK